MPDPITIRIDQKKIAELLGTMEKIPKNLPKVISSCINDSLGKARTIVKRRVGQEISLPAAKINKQLSLIRSTADSLSGKIHVSRKAVPLIDYGARQTRAGVTVRVRKDGSRELMKGQFVATMPSGHVGVYRRAKEGTRRVKKVGKKTIGGIPLIYSSELPIKQRYGPTVVGVVAGVPGLIAETLKEIEPQLYKRFKGKAEALLKNGSVASD